MKNSCKKNIGKLLLISMPFQEYRIPSIQLAILKSYLKSKGILVDTSYLYIKFAKFMGEKCLSYIKQLDNPELLYCKFLFPEYYKKAKSSIVNLLLDGGSDKKIVEKVYEKISLFHRTVMKEINWDNYDVIGFTISYSQMAPSLYLASRIKFFFKDKKIVFGGTGVKGKMGESILKTFSFVDYLISGNGETGLENLMYNARGKERLSKVKGLIYRKNGQIISNGEQIKVSFNLMPTPDYTDYFNELNQNSSIFKKYADSEIRLFVEVARGCFWKKCTFCSSSFIYPRYYEKRPEQVSYEIKKLRERHFTKKFWLVGDSYKLDNFRSLADLLLESEYEFDLMIYTRCGFKKKDYELLKRAGVNYMMIGIESFSPNLLEKMKKGVRAIRNIETLKFCEENGINCVYNLFYDFPNFDEIDFKETVSAIDYLRSFYPPETITDFELQYMSFIYQNFRDFEIKNFFERETDKLLYPLKVRKNLCFFNYQYEKENNKSYLNSIEKQISSWAEKYYSTKTSLLFYLDNGKELRIFESRFNERRIKVLNGIYRKIFLFCDQVRHINEIKEKFSNFPFDDISSFLKEMNELKLIFREINSYLSIPIRKNKMEMGEKC